MARIFEVVSIVTILSVGYATKIRKVKARLLVLFFLHGDDSPER